MFILYMAVLKYGCGIRLECIRCPGNHPNEYCIIIEGQKEDVMIVRLKP
jgi:hypothetical protein